MNGLKFGALIALVMTFVIIVLDHSQVDRVWHVPALVGIIAVICVIIFSIINKKEDDDATRI